MDDTKKGRHQRMGVAVSVTALIFVVARSAGDLACKLALVVPGSDLRVPLQGSDDGRSSWLHPVIMRVPPYTRIKLVERRAAAPAADLDSTVFTAAACGMVVATLAVLRASGDGTPPEVEAEAPKHHYRGTSDAAGDFGPRWQDEIARCWATAPDGQHPGKIADLLSSRSRSDSAGGEHLALKSEFSRRWRSDIKARAGGAPGVEHNRLALGGYVSATAIALAERCRAELCEPILRRFQDVRPGAAVADVGCGVAFAARRLVKSRAFSRVYATDFSASMLIEARRRAEEEGLGPADGLLLFRGDVQELPFAPEVLDCVVWGMGIHVVKHPEVALRSIHASLKPGGFLCATSEASFPMDRARRLAFDAGFGDVSVFRSESTGLLQLLASRCITKTAV